MAVTGTGLLARAIIWLTRAPISHVGLVVGAEPPLVMEALWRVKTRPLWVSIADTRAAYLLKPVRLGPTARSRIVVRACRFSAESYGFLKLFLQFLDALAGRIIRRRVTYFTDALGWISGRPICSYEVGEAYKADGLDFGVPARSVTPADIWEFAHQHKDAYQIVRLKPATSPLAKPPKDQVIAGGQ